jgi:peptidoglycan-associated lipoprotein
MKRSLYSIFSAILLSSALVACSSGVKLNEAPVESLGTISNAAGAGGNASGVANRGVEPVQLGSTAGAGAGPVNVARVIYFDYDSFTVKPEFQSVIQAHANFLAANKGRRLTIEGNTDERGGREYNLALGQKRAEAVRRDLGLMGVSDAQVEAVSFGKEKPAVMGNDEDALAKNRRAEINYR